MPTLPADFAAHIAGDALTLATCVKITRRDGQSIGFNSCGVPLTVDGTLYRPDGGVTVTAVRQTLGLGVDNLSLSGALLPDGITLADILAGRWDGADVRVFVVNFNDPAGGGRTFFAGRAGNVTTDGRTWSMEGRSWRQLFAQQIGRTVSLTCPYRRLGDAECKVNVALFRFPGTVTAVDADNRVVRFSGQGGKPAAYYSEGVAAFTSGANAGEEFAVKRHTVEGGVAVLEFQEPLPLPVEVGDTATLEAGDDRTFATCKNKFNNAVNFGGHPHVPGADSAAQTPTPPPPSGGGLSYNTGGGSGSGRFVRE